jgi:tetratricopeptide (TPR) repeat protein
MTRIYLLVLVVLLTSACAPRTSVYRLPPVEEGSQRAEEGPAETPGLIQAPPSSPARSSGAVIALLDRADGYHSAGDYGNEAATIERALRIDPNNARLWTRLAATRLQQGQPRQAEQLALKSNALAAGDTALQARNWRLVAKARRVMDDAAGARSAEQKASQLSRF